MIKSKKYYLSKNKIKFPNVFIGGVSATINTAAVLASKLTIYGGGSIVSADIKAFSIIGLDIQFYISKNFVITGGLGTAVTYIIGGSKMKGISGNNSFSNTILFQSLEAPEMINLNGGSVFTGNPKLRTFYTPKNITIGTTTADNGVFRIRLGLFRLYVDEYLATCNSGAPDSDLVSTNISPRYARYFSASNPNLYVKPSNITDLSLNQIFSNGAKITWSEPSNLNGMDYYEIYVNGILNNIAYNKLPAYGTHSTMTANVVGLTNGINYNITIVGVDRYYNKSSSNTLNITTSGNKWFLDSLQHYYKFEESSGTTCNDSKGSLNGTNDAGIVLSQTGKHGSCYYFNGSSRINLGNPTDILGQNTTAMWLKVEDWVSRRCPIQGNTYTGWGTWNFYQDGILRNLMGLGGGNYTTVGGGTLSLNTWTHFAVVRDLERGILTTYVNGVRVIEGLIDVTTSQSANLMHLGYGYSGYWKGWIDEVAMFSKAFTDEEVFDFYNNSLASVLM